MIATPRNSNAHLASAWTAGIALLFLGIGLEGAMTPLLPEVTTEVARIDIGDEVMVEDFDASSAAVGEVTETAPPELPEVFEIPPVPEITPPLTPPEMVALTPLEPVIEKRLPASKPPEPKPGTAARNAATQTRAQGAGAGSGEPQMFTGGAGGGRFPAPSYPASARSAGLQGSLRLTVTVEASGLPGAVSVSSSSGHAILDNAARDHIQRRWRWPAGEVRRYIVPVKFVLE
jgi:protein TonB